MTHLFRRYPGAVRAAAEVGVACAFDLRLVAAQLPPYPVGAGHTEESWLRHLTPRAGGTDHRSKPGRRTRSWSTS